MNRVLVILILAKFWLPILDLGTANIASADAKKHEREKHPILVDDDDRRTVQEFAMKKQISTDKVEKMFEATGKIDCPWAGATGNLVLKQDLIVTNAHVLLDRSGRSRGKANKCWFTTSSGGKKIRVRLSTDYTAGHAASKARSKVAQDWVVVRLTDRVSGVVPYSVPSPANPLSPSDEASSKGKWPVTVVAARHADWPVQNGKLRKDVKSIGDCAIRVITWPGFIFTYKDVRHLRSDCDVGPGASGGAYLIDVFEKRVLVGLITGVGLDYKLGRHKFDLANHSSWGVLLSGAFLKTVNDMASLMNVAEVQRALKKKGYNPGPLDGQLGDKTRNAIIAYELNEGMPATGKVSLELSKSLARIRN